MTAHGSPNPAAHDSIRAFVGVYPDAAVARELKQVQQKLQTELRTLKIRWTPPDQLHITLQFLGNIQSSRLPEFETALEKVTVQTASFTAVAETLGCFPNAKRPKIIWAGLNHDAGSIVSLKAQLDAALTPLGFVPDSRPFHPHFTVARVGEVRSSDVRKIDDALARFSAVPFGSWPVRTIALMKSELSADGATHSLIRSFILKD